MVAREEIIRRLESDEAGKLFEENGVLAAYLFGSVASGRTHANSDVDVAVVFHHSVPKKEHLDRRIALIGALGSLLETDDMDVVPLNDAPLLLAFEALRDPVSVYTADAEEAAEFELKTFGLWYDFMPILDSYIEEMKLRIKERKLA